MIYNRVKKNKYNLGGAMDVMGGMGSLFDQAKQNFSGFNPLDFQNTNVNASSVSGLQTALNNYEMPEVTFEKSDPFSQGLEGATTGASAGASFGPWGAIAGGVIGAGTGVASSIFGNDAKARAAEARKLELEREHRNQVYGVASNINNRNFDMARQNTFANGGFLTEFKQGGTHEENPNGGIPQGVDPQGNPNMVEEGEVKYDNYIFSNRLKLTNALAEQYNLPTKYIGKTFADITKLTGEESEERENDPISKRGLKAEMAKLQSAQESMKSKENDTPMQNIFAKGGPLDDFTERVNKRSKADFIMRLQEGADRKSIPTWEDPENSISNFKMFSYEKDGHEVIAPMIQNLNGSLSDFTDPKSHPYKNRREMFDNAIKSAEARGDTINAPIGIGREWAENKYKKYYPGFDSNKEESNVFADGGFLEKLRGLKTPKFESSDDILDRAIDKAPGLTPPKEGNFFTNMFKNPNTSNLRFAPVFGSGISAIRSMFEKPDYSNAEALERRSKQMREVDMNPTGEFITPKPFDFNYRTNQLRSANAATTRALAEGSGGNRAAATAALLSANRGFTQGLGDTAIKAEQYNQEQRNKATQFNNAVRARNAELGLRADMFNAQSDRAGLGLFGQAQQMKTAEDRALSQSASANLTNLFDNLGNVGIDARNRQTVASMNSLGYTYDDRGNLIKKRKRIYG